MKFVSVALDVGCIAAAFVGAALLRALHSELPILNRIAVIPWTAENVVPSEYAVLLAVSAVAWILSLEASGVYDAAGARSASTTILAFARSLVLTALAAAAASFVLKMGHISRVFFVYYFALSTLLLLGKHLAVIAFLGRARHVRHRRHAVVIGAGRPAFAFAKVLTEAGASGYELLGVLLTRKVVSADLASVPVLGMVDDLDRVLAGSEVHEVFIVGGAAEHAGLAPVAQRLVESGRVVSLVTAMASGRHGVRGRVTEFSGVPMLSFGPMPRDEVSEGFKRTVDIAVAGLAALAALPVGLLVAAAIRLLDPGPVLFKQERLGLRGQRFLLYKFRTMCVDAEQRLRADPELYRRYVENDYKLPPGEDPRISRLGAFLRRSSLDELPQLWNVLRGEMTLVGPRPIVPAELVQYQPYEELFLAVRPGLTGLWQVSGRSSVAYPERAYMDLDYITGNDVVRDLGLIARTLPAVLQKTGAH